MGLYRQHLPQLDGTLFMTDGGLETTLIFHEGIDLPYFAAFDLLRTQVGRGVLRDYYVRYTELARERQVGIILEAPTWRASADWGVKLEYDAEMLAEVSLQAIALLSDIRQQYETKETRIVISGNLGPRGDGYSVGSQMSTDKAKAYHALQIETFAQTDADMVAAFTMNYVDEAIGIVLAARDMRMPVVISFTLETNGHLPSGSSLADAIQRTDDATDGYVSYYMINCAHPSHFKQMLQEGGSWRERIRGLRANASIRSHAELDESPDLDIGNPLELGHEYHELRVLLPNLTVLGGCCGTDHRHVEAICDACFAADT